MSKDYLFPSPLLPQGFFLDLGSYTTVMGGWLLSVFFLFYYTQTFVKPRAIPGIFTFFGPKLIHFQMGCDKLWDCQFESKKNQKNPCKVFLKVVICFACCGENFHWEKKKISQERIGWLPWHSLLGRVVSDFASFVAYLCAGQYC